MRIITLASPDSLFFCDSFVSCRMIASPSKLEMQQKQHAQVYEAAWAGPTELNQTVSDRSGPTLAVTALGRLRGGLHLGLTQLNLDALAFKDESN